MTPDDIASAIAADPRHERRIARWLTTVVVLLVVIAAAAVYFFYHPEHAGAVKCSSHGHPCKAQAAFYNHVDVCKSTLRGYSSDDDIHALGVLTGAKSFNGWGAAGHYSDNSVYVWAYFEYSYNYVVLVKGRCSGGDYASDWFDS